MRWLGIIRKWPPRAAWLTLACLAAACGGGKDGSGPTGPGGGGGGGNLAGDYLLVGANDAAVPAVVNSDVCGQSEVINGGMTLGADGTYQMQFNWQDRNGESQFTSDHGRYQKTNMGVQFSSEAWGDQFEGRLNDGLVWIYYDFCNDNQGPDLYLAFAP